MKIISTFVLFVLLGVYGNAQQNARILAEIESGNGSTIKNAPFSADAVSESVQTLADGNRIVRSSSSKLYRNSEGRFRREMNSGSGGMLGSLYTYGQGVTLLDPVGGYRYMIDPNLRTTRQMVYRPKHDIRIVTGNGVSVTTVDGAALADKAKAEVEAAVAAGKGSGSNTVVAGKIREEIKAMVAEAPLTVARAVTGQVIGDVVDGVTTTVYSASGQHTKWEKRTEELGVQNIEGVEAEGTRTITTIPAGAIGNERPIEITYEKWYSKELQLVVMSKHNDPRFGEQTYRLTNIVRSEPDPSLFTPPNGYRLITEPSGTYTVSPARGVLAERPVAGQAPRAAAAPAAKTKP